MRTVRPVGLKTCSALYDNVVGGPVLSGVEWGACSTDSRRPAAVKAVCLPCKAVNGSVFAGQVVTKGVKCQEKGSGEACPPTMSLRIVTTIIPRHDADRLPRRAE